MACPAKILAYPAGTGTRRQARPFQCSISGQAAEVVLEKISPSAQASLKLTATTLSSSTDRPRNEKVLITRHDVASTVVGGYCGSGVTAARQVLRPLAASALGARAAETPAASAIAAPDITIARSQADFTMISNDLFMGSTSHVTGRHS